MTDETLLSFDNVAYQYPGGIKALKNISFFLKEKERVVILGRNGSGKSTMLLLSAALLKPTEGNVNVAGVDTASKDIVEIRRKVGMVFQNADDQLFMPSVFDDVAFGPRNMGLSHNEVSSRVESALKTTGTYDLMKRRPYELSGGQKKLVSIATVLSMEPRLLLLDEPTSGLDYEGERNFIEVIQALPHAFLLSTHDLTLARKLCNRAIVLDDGVVKFDGPIENVHYPPTI